MASNFSLALQNIRSLRANFDLFSLYIASLNTTLDLIFVTETWIYSNESPEFSLSEYNFRACCNNSYRSGGVGVFIRKQFVDFTCQCYNWNSADLLILNVQLGKHNWIFICIYRFCNGDIGAFCDDLEKLLRNLKNKNIAILGDLNINLLDSNESYSYQTMLASYGFISFMNEPTRLQTCLDHVFIRCENIFDFNMCNLPTHFLDHNFIKINICSFSKRPVFMDYPSDICINYHTLNDLLKSENWIPVYNQVNCDSAYEHFFIILNSHIESSKFTRTFPKIKKLKPWMNSKLLRKINKLKKHSKRLKHDPNNCMLAKYVKNLSKKIKTNVKFVKSLFYKNKFNHACNNTKNTWRLIDDVLGRNSSNKQIKQIYKFQTDTILTSPQLVADEFNNFFINVSQDIISKFSTVNTNLQESNKYIFGIQENYTSSCFFEPIYSSEILSEIKQLKNKRSKGFDGVDNFVVKNCCWYLVDILKFLYNLSLDSGKFPNSLKIAIVIPIFKKGDELLLNNYRPISLLSTISKIFEKLIKRRLLRYLEKIKFLNANQFGFTTGKSTEEALLHFLNKIYSNSSRKTTALFVDIAKAFDTVDHEILILKLSKIGIRGKIQDWFESYIRDRRQVVKISETLSSICHVNCGVPQGSVLGPLLFLIYFNSVFDINLLGHATAFADDLALSYAINDNCSNVNTLLNTDLINLSKWFFYHRLAVSDKSKVMHFGRHITASSGDTLIYHSFSCDRNPCTSQCFPLQPVNEFKYLGLIIDSQLNWKDHLNNTRKNVIITIHTFYKLIKCCPSSTLRKLYHALVESIITYGISSWGGTYFANIEDLFIAQKRIIKLIYKRPHRTPTVPLFRELNLLPLRYLYVYKVLKMFFIRSDNSHRRIAHSYNIRNPL